MGYDEDILISYMNQVASLSLLTPEQEIEYAATYLEQKIQVINTLLKNQRFIDIMLAHFADVESGIKKSSYTLQKEETSEKDNSQHRSKEDTIRLFNDFRRIINTKTYKKRGNSSINSLCKIVLKINMEMRFIQDSANELGICKECIYKMCNAKKGLIEGNLRLVVSIARKFKGRGVPMEDLIQEGNIGLMRAVDGFDYTWNYKFSTYAYYWIRQYISRSVMNCSKTIRIPVHVGNFTHDVSRATEELLDKYGRPPTKQEIMSAMDMHIETYDRLQILERPPLSLDEPIHSSRCAYADEGLKLCDTMPSEPDIAESIDRMCDMGNVKDIVESAILMLTPREQKIIRLYYGIYPNSESTSFRKMRRILARGGEDISFQRLQQIHNNAVRRMKIRFNNEKLKKRIQGQS